MSSVGALKLARLEQGLPAITPRWGGFLAEACIFCLNDQNHSSGVKLHVYENFCAIFEVQWNQNITNQMRRAWNDEQEATEYAACGIAILLTLELTNFTVIERTRKGPGFDYWLGYKGDQDFQNAARLEVSGIRKGNERDIKRRVRDKVKQTNPSDHTRLPAYIIVVEFGKPASHVVKK